MIITKTPFRISFFGGGTDYPVWYRKEGGAVLSTTIDKYCYLTCRYLPPFFSEVRHRIVWRHVETVSNIADILHPAVREGLRYLGFDDSTGLEIHYQGDMPARSGMGSSSAFAVGLIKGLLALRGQTIGKHDLALKAIDLEQNVLKEDVGSQDQVAAAYGGLNVIRFAANGDIHVEPVALSPARLAELQARLVLYYTGTSRTASAVAADVVANIPGKGDLLRKMHALVDRAVAILRSGSDLDEFGRLLDETWQLKRQQSARVTNPVVDGIYRKAMTSGALGGKLLGAGTSGFMVFYVQSGKQAQVQQALGDYLNVPFKFETEGSILDY